MFDLCSKYENEQNVKVISVKSNLQEVSKLVFKALRFSVASYSENRSCFLSCFFFPWQFSAGVSVLISVNSMILQYQVVSSFKCVCS